MREVKFADQEKFDGLDAIGLILFILLIGGIMFALLGSADKAVDTRKKEIDACVNPVFVESNLSFWTQEYVYECEGGRLLHTFEPIPHAMKERK